MLDRVRRRLKEGLPVTIVPYGDSISEFGRDPNYHGGCTSLQMNWSMQLVRLLRQAHPGGEFIVKCFGVGGHNAYEGCGRFDSMPKDADLVLLEFGANDSGWHEIPPKSTAAALERIIECVRYHHKSDLVMLGFAGQNPLDPKGEHEEETRAAIRGVAEKCGLPYVDLRAAVLRATDNGQKWTDYHNGSGDCHPNDRGHALWAATVFETLRREIGMEVMS